LGEGGDEEELSVGEELLGESDVKEETKGRVEVKES
jgi:hypothetical protein